MRKWRGFTGMFWSFTPIGTAEIYRIRNRQRETTLFLYSRREFAKALGQEYRPPRGINSSFEVALWLPEYADVDREYRRLSQLGVQFPCGGPVPFGFGIRNFYVFDPEGSLLKIGSMNAAEG